MTDYKETLNLPKTDFSMRANLGPREPEQIEQWEKQQIYTKMLEKRSQSSPFILHDGPPYANGDLHHGHVLNKVLKDFVVKYKSMAGFYTPFVPGWDCHGLPIEHNVEKQLREENQYDSTSINTLRKLCRDYAAKFVDIQRDQFKRIMVFGDWDHPYITMDYKYEAATLRELGHFFEQDLVYQGLKPVHWDWASQTALAEAEIEYAKFKTEHVYVAFELISYPDSWQKHLGDLKPHCVIWTTTPWTLPSNLGIVLNPDLNYSLLQYGDRVCVIADGLREAFETACELSDPKILHQFEGRELVGELGGPIQYKAKHPFIDRTSALMPGDFVTLDQGTGCVHCAPGHGAEDFQLGEYYGLGVINPVDDAGHFKPNEVPRWGGKHVFAANKLIPKYLDEIGVLLNKVGDKVTIERYPHGWRSKKPVIFRATPQWFVNLDKEDNHVRQKLLDAIEHINWVPRWGYDRILSMLENRPDWCISRQRSWGVPITIFQCDCGHHILDKDLTFYIADLFEKEGADVWFERKAQDLVPEGTTCPECGNDPSHFTKGRHILDVWFDSGTSWAAVVEDRLGITDPVDLYLEGSDQHRGWFNSSLTCKMVTRGETPYKTCLTHGFVTDENGHKYSKSSKNFEPPQKMIDSMGAEILRLWTAAVDYRNDISLTPEVLSRISDAYRKIRNTLRYLLGNLYDFTPNDALALDQLEDLDQWLLSRTGLALEQIRKAYDNFQFHTVFHTLVQLCTVDLSSIYMDISKDRMYCEKTHSTRRRSGQTAMYLVLKTLLSAMAPILSFTAEEVWQRLPKTDQDPESIFLTDFPNDTQQWIQTDLNQRWEQLLDIRLQVQKALEDIRAPRKQKKPGQIGSSQEAEVEITASGDTLSLLSYYTKQQLAEFFITSDVTLLSNNAIKNDLAQNAPVQKNSSETVPTQSASSDLQIKVRPSDNKKCPRCWNLWITDSSPLCPRCTQVLNA